MANDDWILEKVIRNLEKNSLDNCTTKELEMALHILNLDDQEENQSLMKSITYELDKRQKISTNNIAEYGVSWQKWGVIISFATSLAAIIISIIALNKP